MRAYAGIGFLLCVVGPIALTEAVPSEAPSKSNLDADQLAPGLFTGTIVSTPNTDRMLTLDVTYQKVQLKPGQNLARANQDLQKQYNRIVQLQNQMMQPPRRGHNPMQTMQQLQNAEIQFQAQLARTQANLFQVVPATQKVDFQVEEKLKVRIKNPPEAFDEKGNTKKYSSAELAALKGKDRNLPGYESSVDSLEPGQLVVVKLGQHKKPRPPATASTSDGKDKSTADKAERAATEHKLQVQLILILKQSDSQPGSTSPDKSKKDK